MFPFGENPFEPSFKKPPFQLYDQIQNPIIAKHDESPFFSNFPSPFFDEHELPLHQILPKPSIPTTLASSSSDHPKKISHPTKKDPPKPKQKQAVSAAPPRKRTGKKDRHSKICTAQGIRDRRMRLSLQVARKFFDLQDMLGYDKASKTIEWLFTKSKKAIKELAKDTTVSITMSDGKTESFVSECEVVSGIEENCSNNGGLAAAEDEKRPRKTANTRESREKARERARSRTEEKMMGKRIESSPSRDVLEKLGSSSSTAPFDRERVFAYADYAPFVQPPSDAGTIEKLLGNSSSAAAAAVSCCSDPTTSFMGFLENWDLDRLNYAGNHNSIYSATTPDFPLFHQ
ncbi:transcription factor CYCLOIDEA-like [Salvia divinorum]|uniref:Transcription factor CYCLOIDEA-like n=1 Tax=Salvia divinorum TaxID=28513 RepID=A0ABD1H711_SALDI